MTRTTDCTNGAFDIGRDAAYNQMQNVITSLANQIQEKTQNLQQINLSQDQRDEINKISDINMANSYSYVSDDIENAREGFLTKMSLTNRILQESNIQVSQKTYEYTLWSVLAIIAAALFIRVSRN
jgi:lipopolysaccharide export LptBFGC system permease protein LptF